jgi:SAM-dependent methyltransferase
MKTNRTTPQWLVDKMWQMMILSSPIDIYSNTTFKILEPSAGEGNLLNVLSAEDFNITCVELNKEKCDVLRSKNYNTIHGDFLNLNLEQYSFDAVIAAPPFNNNIDVEHIQKMYSLLKTDGVIVTLTSPYWLTNNEKHQVKFREWLKDKKHTIEILPDMTFIEKDKTIPTTILIIEKNKYYSV